MNVISAISPPMSVLLYLANVALASVIVCGGGLIFEQICRRASLPFRHTLLVASIASALAAPIVIGVMMVSGRSLIHFSIAGLETPTSSTQVSVSTLPENSSAAIDLPLAQSALRTKSGDLLDKAGSTPASREVPAGAPALRVRNADRRSFWFDVLPPLGMALAMAWIAGSIVSLGRLMLGLLRLRRLLLGLRPVADTRLLELAAATSRQLGLRRAPRLYESQAVLSPLSVGFIYPMIVLPVGIESSFDTNQLRGLFLHEIAHFVRRDHQIGVLQQMTMILFWWNLLTRRASARVSATREQICDDISTGAGSADVYAAMLVELAGRVAYSRDLPAAIGVFDGTAGEFSQRIHRLLDPHRRIITKLDGRSKAAAAICFLLLLLPGASPLEVRAAAVDESPPAGQSNEAINGPKVEPAKGVEEKDHTPKPSEATPFNWPKVLRGVIKDADGKPIAGAHVRFDFEKIHEYNVGRWDELLDTQSQVTGNDGEYRFDTIKLPKLTHRPFLLSITATADGYADAKWWSWYSHSDVDVGEHLANVKMLPGRVVRGRCVDPDGILVSGAVVKMASDYDPKTITSSSAWDPRMTHEDGTFEFSIPRDSEAGFEIWAVHPQWAPQRATLAKDSDTFGDIRLQKGTTLHGTVRKADGKPVSGTVVAAVSNDRGELKNLAFEATVAVKTDAQGNYTLQSLAGVWTVYLTEAEENNNSLENRFVVADGAPPLVEPARVELLGSEPQSKDFRAGPTLKVRGMVRWPDGKPVEHCEVQVSYLPENRLGIWIGRTWTDGQGHYEIRLPNLIDHVIITVLGMHDKNNVWYFAFPVDTVDAKAKNQQNISLNPLKGDSDGMDWVLKSDKQ